jgi:hypothetical protein
MSEDEKEYLRNLVQKELDGVKKTGKSVVLGSTPAFLKAEHEFEHFLENLLEKLK